MTKVVVGVDPGKKCGVACIVDRAYAWARTIKGDRIPQVVGVVQVLRQLADEHGGLTVAIELQFMARGHKSNPKAIETLLRRRHIWEFACEIYGLPVVKVWPSTWQSQLKEAQRFDEKGKKRTPAQRAIDVANRRLAAREWTEDEACAGLIARWYVNQPKQETML